jgi:hypothetical protein
MCHAANRSIQSDTLRKGRAAPLFGIAFVFLASSCSQSTPSATLPPSAVPSPTPTSSPPPGGPVPSQLWGNWYLPGAAVRQVTAGTIPCPSNPTPTNCFFQLMLGGSTWYISYIASGGIQVPSQGKSTVMRWTSTSPPTAGSNCRPALDASRGESQPGSSTSR